MEHYRKVLTQIMSDILSYNTGSLLGTLNPYEYFYNLNGEAFAENIDNTFKEAASVDGQLYGIPMGSSQCGAVLYNKENRGGVEIINRDCYIGFV